MDDEEAGKMDVFETIKTRRSVRKYKDIDIPKNTIFELIRYGCLAPSAGNGQPWQFVVVHRSFLDKLEATLVESFDQRIADGGEDLLREAVRDLPIPTREDGDKVTGLKTFYRTLGGAPVGIAVCVPKEQDPWVWRNHLSDAAAAIENVLLAAWGLGFGTCWMTGPLKTKGDAIASLLEVPKNLEIVAIVALGYPDHKPEMPPKGDVNEKVKWIGFDVE